MQITTALAALRGYGYEFEPCGGIVEVTAPVHPPPEANVLLNILRSDKSAVLAALSGSLIPVAASEGDSYEVTFDGGDEKRQTRWAVALREGLIVLDGPVRVHLKDHTVCIAYRAALPPDWLQEDIIAACKEHYNAILERIHKGEAWFKAHADDPRYEEHYTRFTALFGELKELYTAINEPLEDPFLGFQESNP